MGRACKDVVSIAGPIISLLSTAAPAAKSFLEKTPKMPKLNTAALPEKPIMPTKDNKNLQAAAKREMLRSKGGGRESTILSEQETLGG